jgi:hypothetical protein
MKKILVVLLILTSTNLTAQKKILADTVAVNSINGIINKMLSIISGEKGKKRNWDDFRKLFLPTAYFIVLNNNDSIPRPIDTATLEQFISSMNDDYYNNGFVEYEISKVVNEYNGIANVFQTFYGKDSENKEEKGINSYQLVYFNHRWWIANVLWTGDNNGVKVPKKYLGH